MRLWQPWITAIKKLEIELYIKIYLLYGLFKLLGWEEHYSNSSSPKHLFNRSRIHVLFLVQTKLMYGANDNGMDCFYVQPFWLRCPFERIGRKEIDLWGFCRVAQLKISFSEQWCRQWLGLLYWWSKLCQLLMPALSWPMVQQRS